MNMNSNPLSDGSTTNTTVSMSVEIDDPRMHGTDEKAMKAAISEMFMKLIRDGLNNARRSQLNIDGAKKLTGGETCYARNLFTKEETQTPDKTENQPLDEKMKFCVVNIRVPPEELLKLLRADDVMVARDLYGDAKEYPQVFNYFGPLIHESNSRTTENKIRPAMMVGLFCLIIAVIVFCAFSVGLIHV